MFDFSRTRRSWSAHCCMSLGESVGSISKYVFDHEIVSLHRMEYTKSITPKTFDWLFSGKRKISFLKQQMKDSLLRILHGTTMEIIYYQVSNYSFFKSELSTK